MRPLLAAVFAVSLAASPALAQDAQPVLKLCPPTVQKTCFIGYVTEATKLAIFLTSTDGDPFLGQTVVVTGVDLSKDVGGVVMLDGVANNAGVDATKIVQVADPLLTAIYVATFSLPPDDGSAE